MQKINILGNKRRWIASLLLLIFIFSLVILLQNPRQASAAVAVQSGFPVTNFSSGNRTLISQSVTVAAGAGNRVLVVETVHEDAGGAVTSVVFNSTENFTKIDSSSATTWSHVEMWYLKNPTVTTADVDATKASSGVNRWGIAIYVLEGVNQTTSIGTPAKGSADSGTSVSRSLSDLSSGDLALDVLSLDATGHSAAAAGTGHTKDWGTLNLGANINEGQGGITTNTGGSLDWTWTTSAPYSHMGVVFKSATTNASPAAPTLNSPANSAAGIPAAPDFQLRTSDAEGDYLRYKIEVCSTSNCSAIVRTIDQTASQTGWSGQDQQTATAYSGNAVITSSTMAIHTYQTPILSPNTQYWWRGYAIDPGGSNSFSGASAISTFTTGNSPAVPTLITPAASATGVAYLPVFQLRTSDTESDYLKYFIQIYDATACGGSQVGSNIDQTASQTGWQGQDAGPSGNTAYYGSSTLANSTIARYQYSGTALLPNQLYSWRAKAIDPGGSNAFGSLSGCQDFTTGSSEVRINGGVNINGGTTIQ